MQHSSRSAFPFKKELAIVTLVWLTYAVPSAMLYLHPKRQVANICWAIIAAMTAFVIIPFLIRVWWTWPVTPGRAPAPE